jgi:hypothetical protein
VFKLGVLSALDDRMTVFAKPVWSDHDINYRNITFDASTPPAMREASHFLNSQRVGQLELK